MERLFVHAVGFAVLLFLALENGAFAKKRARDVRWHLLRNGTNCDVKAQLGDVVSMMWYSYIEGNRSAIYDSTFPFGPVQFRLGKDRHIAGFEKGVVGMCEGEERTVFIPAEVAFPDQVMPPTIERLRRAWPIMRFVKANFTFETILRKVVKPTWQEKAMKGVYVFAPFTLAVAVICYLLIKVAKTPDEKKALKEQRLQKKKGQGKKLKKN
ncbi:FKBP2 [Branchiostoma lanceolatum]|uniref:peptidylprolyl isomerase n=1 Tax=Branchiostoma lanceolatum TaxID=7740 RepID=A0A8K0EFS4_BRALA|nr:FKBP2 [Branchiostoma lanceolatum]